jgi:hypothetical protein
MVPAACSCGIVACALRPKKWWAAWAAGAGVSWVIAAVLAGTAVLLPCLLIPVGVIVFETVARAKRIQATRSLLPAALLTLVVSVAALLRFAVLPAMLRRDLDADAIAFMGIAEKAHLFNTDSREPLFIWLLKLMRLFTGEYSAAALRTTSILVSIGVTAAVFQFARRHIGLLAATVAGLAYAYAPAFVFTATRGLREELIVAFFLLFAHICIVLWGKPPTLRGAIALGLAYLLCNYIRLSSNAFCAVASLGVFAWSAARHRLPARRWWLAAVPIAVGFLPVAPYLIYCQQRFGDPFFSVSIHTRFYANLELEGTPGFPTREELEKDAYAGGPMSMGEYVFAHHSLKQVAGRTAWGAWRVFFSHDWRDFPTVAVPAWTRYPEEWLYHFGDFNLAQQPRELIRVSPAVPVLAPWLMTAALLALCLPGRRLFLALVFLFHAPALFIAALEMFDWRLLTVVFAALHIGLGAAAQSLASLPAQVRAWAMAHGMSDDEADEKPRRP